MSKLIRFGRKIDRLPADRRHISSCLPEFVHSLLKADRTSLCFASGSARQFRDLLAEFRSMTLRPEKLSWTSDIACLRTFAIADSIPTLLRRDGDLVGERGRRRPRNFGHRIIAIGRIYELSQLGCMIVTRHNDSRCFSNNDFHALHFAFGYAMHDARPTYARLPKTIEVTDSTRFPKPQQLDGLAQLVRSFIRPLD